MSEYIDISKLNLDEFFLDCQKAREKAMKKIHNIIVEKTVYSATPYVARIEGCKESEEYGNTPQEAIGNIIRNNLILFNLTLTICDEKI